MRFLELEFESFNFAFFNALLDLKEEDDKKRASTLETKRKASDTPAPSEQKRLKIAQQ